MERISNKKYIRNVIFSGLVTECNACVNILKPISGCKERFSYEINIDYFNVDKDEFRIRLIKWDHSFTDPLSIGFEYKTIKISKLLYSGLYDNMLPIVIKQMLDTLDSNAIV